MKIHVLSRRHTSRQIEEHGCKALQEQFNIISIQEPGVSSPFTLDHPNALKMYFDDIEFPIKKMNGEGYFTLFTEDMAKEVIEFLRFRVDPNKDFIIHCQAGICRSGACGVFVQEFFNLNYKDFYDMNRQIHPNTHVLSTLRAEMRKL